MITDRLSFPWLLVGTAFAAVCVYLILQLPQLNYSYLGFSDSYRLSTALFIGGSFQLMIGLVLGRPKRKSYYVPQGMKEYRDPFVGLDREELSDHGYGTDSGIDNVRRRWEGFAFSFPGLVAIIASFLIAWV